jgi:Calx-beta domain
MGVRSAWSAGLCVSIVLGLAGPASAAFSISGDVTAPEGSAGPWTATFTVTDDTAAPFPRTVQWNAAYGSAVDGSTGGAADYAPAGGRLEFPGGTTSQTVSVTVHGDTTFEPDESFTVRIHYATAPPANCWPDPFPPACPSPSPVQYPIADDTAAVTLLNDDARPPKAPEPKRPECTIASIKKRTANHPYFKGSQFFGLMRLAAKGLGPGGITALLEGKATLHNVLTCPKGILAGKVEMLRAGARPLLLARGRDKLDFAGAGRTLLRLRTTAGGRAALSNRARVRARVTIRHVDTQGTAAQRRFAVTLTR